MKKAILIAAIWLVGCHSLFAQKAVLTVSFDNIKNVRCFISKPADIANSFSEITLVAGKRMLDTIRIDHPCFVGLSCTDMSSGKFFNYQLFLSPGDNLELQADLNKPDFAVTVTGRGSNNNQPLMGLMKEQNEINSFYKDTLPVKVINALNTAQRIRENNLEKYITVYKPSQDFINAWHIDLPYIISSVYYGFKENNKYQIGEAYKRNYARWKQVQDSLFAISRLDNDDALTSYHYNSLIDLFFNYERERLLNLAGNDPQGFYKEWYNTDTLTGKKLLINDRRNLLHEKIINRYFTGKCEEYMYALLFNDASHESAPQNIPGIFKRFKVKYPDSKYITMFAPFVDNIETNRKRVLTDKMVFMADNGIKLNTIEDVLAAMKGKTVLVDMWGTWCGPCREDIEKHSASIREHFKGKHLDYLYIANMDLKNGELWKKLIAYFDMEGTHVLANDNLTKDIMTKVHGQGFPTTFIIRKDGTFELSKSQYPLNEDVLEKQLEEALAE